MSKLPYFLEIENNKCPNRFKSENRYSVIKIVGTRYQSTRGTMALNDTIVASIESIKILSKSECTYITC
jgi:hypothetical protein